MAKSFPLVTNAAHHTPIPPWEVNHCGGPAVHRSCGRSHLNMAQQGAQLHLFSKQSETEVSNAAYSWSLLYSTQITSTKSPSTHHGTLNHNKDR